MTLLVPETGKPTAGRANRREALSAGLIPSRPERVLGDGGSAATWGCTGMWPAIRHKCQPRTGRLHKSAIMRARRSTGGRFMSDAGSADNKGDVRRPRGRCGLVDTQAWGSLG